MERGGEVGLLMVGEALRWHRRTDQRKAETQNRTEQNRAEQKQKKRGEEKRTGAAKKEGSLCTHT
jgi:hypothetical protein